jgi:hypothetical protein
MAGDESLRELLARIDERTKNLAECVDTLAGSVVSKEEFRPVKSIVYGGVGLVLTSVVAALIALVVKGGHF